MSGGGKEENLEVICNVCDNFECHVFKKNVCRNCFHSKEEHAASNGDQEVLPRKQDINQPFDDTGKSKDMNLLGDKNKPKSGTGFSKSTPDILKKSTENLKDESDVKVDSKNKGKPPETHSKSKPPETAPKSKAPGKLVTGALSVKERLELKQKGSTGASSDSNKKPAQTKESEVKGNVSSLVTSQGSKKQTTADNKSSPVETSDSKPGEKSDANKKQGLTTTKVFTNSKLAGSSLLSQDKGLLSNLGKKQSTDKKDSGSLSQVKDSSSGDKNTSKISTKSEESSSKKSSVTTSKADDGSKVKHLTSKSEEFSSKTKQTTSKFEDKSKVTTSKTEEISNKFKQLSSKSFTGNNKEGLADTKFNSLGRKKVGVKEKLPSDTGTAADDCSAGTIKSPSSKEQGISHRAALGTGSAVSTSDKNTAQPIPGVNKSATGSLSSRFGGSKYGATPDNASGAVQNGAATKDKLEQLSTEKAKVNEELDLLRKKLSDMEGKCQSLDEENKHLREGMTEKDLEGSKVLMEKRDVENAIKGLKSQLTSMEVRCEKLETDNTSLLDKLKEQHIQQQQHQKENIENDDVTTEIADMEQQVDASEAIVTDLKDENDDLRQEIQDLKVEMDEMYDSFRDQEAEEFRDLQRELEITAKNCRILQFKLRKAERQNESVEGDRLQYEDKLRMLQNQFKDDDARAHIRSIEQELQMAKEVSVRLHDELDIMEDRRSKVEEENLHLTDILEKSDKKQFRLEMEIDKLKDKIVDLQNQLANRTDRESPASEEVTDRRVILGRMGKQSSQELDSSQLMKDLYDSMERETDLKDQLQLMEEEAKTSRRKLEELEEENENLSIQLKKMSAAQVIKGKEGFRETTGFPASEEEAELKIHLDLNNQELSVLKKKFHDLEEDNENLLMECGKLSEELRQKEILLNVLPEPSSPNYYYEDKIKDMKIEADELRWKIIEKEREIERLNAQCVLQTRQSRLKMSRSLEGEHHLGNVELKKQVENIQLENSILKDKVIRLTGGRKDEAEDLLSSPVSDQKQLATTYPGDGESVKDDKLRALQLRIDQLEKHRPLSPPSDNIGNIGYKSAKSKVSRDASRVTSRDAPRDLLQQQRPSVLDLREASVYNDNSVRSRSPGGASRVSTGSSLPRIDTPVPSPACLPSIAKPSFPGLRSVDVLSPGETREELMDQILDMEEEVEKLTGSVKLKDQELTKLYGEVRGLKDTIQNLKDEFRKKEIELLRDLDVSHDKADILSNLLDIVKERADDAEAELERLIESQSCSATSSENSARTVSTLSNVSSGSDEVFDGSGSVPGSPDTGGRHLIHKNWENQFRKRINCLERLLAEERKRVATTEKKLALVSTETLSSAMSDDAKLHEREKELLQSEVLDSTKLLKIASDQIKGLRERVLTLEDENKVLQSSQTMAETEDSDIDQTPSGSVDTVIERPIGGVGTEGAKAKTPSQSEDEIIILGNEVEVYHSKVLELEAHLEEVNEYWQSQIVNRDKERESFMKEAKKMSEDCDALKDTISKLKDEDIRKEKLLKDLETMVQDKVSVVFRKEEILQEREEIIRQREEDMQSMLDQISQKDDELRELRENLRSRDECLREKDVVLESVNTDVTDKEREINYFNDELTALQGTLDKKDQEISILEERITEIGSVKQSDLKTENIRQKGDLESLATNLGKLHVDNSTLQSDLEKAKQALSEAMVLWNKDRSNLEAELNIVREKLHLYQSTLDKNEPQVVATLRKEAHKILEQKEKVSGDYRVLRVENDANIRTLKNEKYKLQEELTQKIRQLTAEMTTNDKNSQELDRLRAQEDIAYQIQHHEKLLRAEYLAMKVRYETRLENLQKEHMNLLSLLDTMQREKTLDKEIIRGVQKGMSQMKVTYAKDLVKWDAEKDILARHIKEIDEGRKLAKDMQGKIEELKNQLADQEYERAELVNRITTERSGWGVDKSNMQSKINQLQEQLAMVSQAQNRTKNMQNRMEVAWEQERSEQKRLLAEAHSLALDLQSQLKARDEEYVRERKMLIEQLRRMRTEIDEEQLSRDSRQKEIDERGLRISELDRILKEVGERASKEQEMSVKERADLVRRLGEMRKQHKRDQRRVEDVLTGLTRLKELAAIVSDSEKEGNTSDTELVSRLEKLSTGPLPELDVDLADPMHLSPRKSIRQRIDQVVLKHIKESLKEIHFAVEDIGRPREISEEERKKLRRSLSSSEIDFLKEDFSAGRQRDSGKFDSPKASPLTIQTDTASPRYLRSVTHNGSGDLLNQPACDLLLEINPITSLPLRQKFIMADVHYEQSVSTKFPDPPPSFLISPKSHSRQTLTDTTFSLYSQKTLSSKSQDANQPLNVNKTRLAPTSISLDTTRVNSLHTGSQSKLNTKSVSAGGTPTYESASLLSSIPVLNRGTSSDTSLSPRSGNSSNSGSYERLTPRSARRKFFEDQSDLQPSSSMSEKSQSCEGIQEDKISTKPPTVDTKRLRLQHDESEDDMIGQLIEDTKPRILTQSVSVDEKTSHSVAKSSSTESKKSKPEKPKRKIIKRSQSVDSSVKKSVAKAGITAMSPGAPSNTKAVELFATVRRKIKNTLKRSSSMTDEEKSTAKQGSSSEASGSTSGEEFNKAGGQKSSGMVYRPSTSVHKPMVGVQKSTTSPEHESQSKPPPTPPISSMNRRALPEMEDDALTNGRKRIPDISPDNKPNKRLRSKSAERATRGPSALKQQVILEEDLLPDRSKVFSETTV
ncbi:golgin subfamily A member 4-like isoform X2 [Mizuhopecten yessoensis]|uniref:golgin subfamily A member 4-like isoform X2 n=1 Tax=Mizuhopecten yessoensis TaxID=6573 RepID=UPI000B459B69|nr:golgin subfamily A member 4-like isoform X2 [Mizuhopecten yessoensis]